MKLFKFIILLLFLYQMPSLFGQKTQVDILLGTSRNSGLVMGVAVKNILQNSWGWYYHTAGSGHTDRRETGVDYSSISDRTEYTDYGIVENNTYGMTLGATYDMSTLIKKEDSGLTLFIGLGYAVKESISQRFEYYIWDSSPRLNEGNLISWVSDSKTIPSVEIMMGYDLFKTGMFKINLNAGYSTSIGLFGTIGIGLAPYY